LIDRLNDPVLRQLARLEPLEPDPRHSASVRSRCQATLARRREQRESTARSRATVAGILEDLRLDVKQHGVRTHADGTWELVAGYRTPWERQHAILAGRLGDDYLTVVSESFLRGKR